MTQRIADRVYQTSATTGVGPYQFGPVMPGGYRAFSEIAGIADGDTVDVYVDQQDSREYEVGTYTYRSGGTLERTSVAISSNGGNPVDWQVGTRRIGLALSARQINTLPATVASPQVFATNAAMLAAVAQGAGATPVPFLPGTPRRLMVLVDETNGNTKTFYDWDGVEPQWSPTIGS